MIKFPFRPALSFVFLLVTLMITTLPLLCAENPDAKSFHHPLRIQLETMSQRLEKELASDNHHLPALDLVKDFGADKSGLSLCTGEFQKAIDSCASLEGARLIIPEGAFLTGTLFLRSGVHISFQNGSKIIGSTRPEDYIEVYPAYKNNTDLQVNKSLIYAENVEDISLTGKGIIDFQGDHPVYLCTGNNDPRRPFGIRIVSSRNIYVNGLMLINSPQWMQHYLNCENVMIENLNVINHAHQNNDGLDIDGCRNVYVRNCRIDSDDDAICLKSNGPAACENVLIEHCVAASHCNALKLGTETTGGFKNIIYRNCRIVPSVTGNHHVNGVETTRTAITLIITDGGAMENVWFDSIDAQDCITPVFITLGNRSRPHTKGAPEPGIGSIENIYISNVNATGAGPISSSATGLDPENPIKNLTLKNIYITLGNPGSASDAEVDMIELLEKVKPAYPSPHVWSNLPSAAFYFRYIDGLIMERITVNTTIPDPREPMIIEDCTDTHITGAKF